MSCQLHSNVVAVDLHFPAGKTRRSAPPAGAHTGKSSSVGVDMAISSFWNVGFFWPTCQRAGSQLNAAYGTSGLNSLGADAEAGEAGTAGATPAARWPGRTSTAAMAAPTANTEPLTRIRRHRRLRRPCRAARGRSTLAD